MNRTAFYDAVRASLFGGVLTQPQVDGMDAILNSCARNHISDPHHISNILSNVHRETGGYMLGVKETVMSYHRDKNPSDKTVIARLDKAWRDGRLKHVSKPYWRDGGFGRGPIQVSHVNYARIGKRLGVDLKRHPEKLLEPGIGADSAVIGMSEGIFTGKKLSDYNFPSDLGNSPRSNPRRIVNGRDGSDGEVAKSHRAFHAALISSGGTPSMPAEGKPTGKTKIEAEAKAPPEPNNNVWGSFVAFLLRLISKKGK